MPSSQKDLVRRFWDSEACGERYGDDQFRIRYELEPEIAEFAEFPTALGKKVLEIGVGMGADFTRWEAAGADVIGIDLTERAIATARTRSRTRRGMLLVADAESLPFRDNDFDIVYSWGVLHHTPDTERAITEAIRVLAPGGALKIMLYHRRSWVAIAAWMRFCLLRGRPFRSLRTAVRHIESSGTQAFSRAEGRQLLKDLGVSAVWSRLTHWDRRVAPGIARLLGDCLGWFLLLEGKKHQDVS